MENIEQLNKVPTPRESLFELTKDIERIQAHYSTFVRLAMEDSHVDLDVLETEPKPKNEAELQTELQLFDRDLEGEVIETYDLYTAGQEMLAQVTHTLRDNLETDDWQQLEEDLQGVETELATWQTIIEANFATNSSGPESEKGDGIVDTDSFEREARESLLTAVRNILEEARTQLKIITDGTEPELPL